MSIGKDTEKSCFFGYPHRLSLETGRELAYGNLTDCNSVKDLKCLSSKSSLIALIMLISFLFLGHFIFTYVFHIELYAFMVTCGVVLFYNGITGLQKGSFIQLEQNVKLKDLSAVPITMPMIAGPATITAAFTFTGHYGKLVTIIAIAIAIGINLILMLNAIQISTILTRFKLINALIRITGLIVGNIGTQMIFNGI